MEKITVDNCVIEKLDGGVVAYYKPEMQMHFPVLRFDLFEEGQIAMSLGVMGVADSGATMIVTADVLQEAIRMFKSEIVPPGIGSELKLEIDPEVESLVSGCKFRTNSSSDPTWRCQAKDEGEDGKLPACLVVTRDDLNQCKRLLYFCRDVR